MIEYLKYLSHLIKNFFNPHNNAGSLAVIKIDRYGKTHVVLPEDERYNDEITRLELKRNNETFLDKVRNIFNKLFRLKDGST